MMLVVRRKTRTMAPMIGENIREQRQAQGRSLGDVGLFLVLAKVRQVTAHDLLEPDDEDNGKVDPLARRIAMLETKQRTELWREVAAERRAQRGRNGRNDAAQQVEEMLAQIDFLRDELETVRKRIKKR